MEALSLPVFWDYWWPKHFVWTPLQELLSVKENHFTQAHASFLKATHVKWLINTRMRRPGKLFSVFDNSKGSSQIQNSLWVRMRPPPFFFLQLHSNSTFLSTQSCFLYSSADVMLKPITSKIPAYKCLSRSLLLILADDSRKQNLQGDFEDGS